MRPPQPLERRHRDQEVAELERAQRQELGAVSIAQFDHGPRICRLEPERHPGTRMGRRFTVWTTGNRPHMTASASPALILFDRDDTLIEDRPALRDPREVRAMPSAESAVSLARHAGMRLGVISNQPVIA